MEQLKMIKEQLTNKVVGAIGNFDTIDAKELESVINSIHHLSEAIYYCTITEAMEDKEKTASANNYFYTTNYGYDEERDMDRPHRMYYSSSSGSNSSSRGNSSSNSGNGNNGGRYYTETEINPMRDYREGRSSVNRRMYMEAKEMKRDKASQVKELENYISELSSDITEMIADASPEEKQLLQKKLTILAQKVNSSGN